MALRRGARLLHSAATSGSFSAVPPRSQGLGLHFSPTRLTSARSAELENLTTSVALAGGPLQRRAAVQSLFYRVENLTTLPPEVSGLSRRDEAVLTLQKLALLSHLAAGAEREVYEEKLSITIRVLLDALRSLERESKEALPLNDLSQLTAQWANSLRIDLSRRVSFFLENLPKYMAAAAPLMGSQKRGTAPWIKYGDM